MKLSKRQFTTVTPFSKVVAGILFILLPFLGFSIGYKFGNMDEQLMLRTNNIPVHRVIEQQDKSEISISSPSATPRPDPYVENSELHGFPIYPGAYPVTKQFNPACPQVPEELTRTHVCNSVTYIWQTRDDAQQVTNWYKQIHNGWSCNVGGGTFEGPRNAGAGGFCQNGNSIRNLQYTADPVKTEIRLNIPVNEYSGRWFN